MGIDDTAVTPEVRTAAVLATAPTPWGELGVVSIDRAGDAGELHVVHRTPDFPNPPILHVTRAFGPGGRSLRTEGGAAHGGDGTVRQQFGLRGLPRGFEAVPITIVLRDGHQPQREATSVALELVLPPAHPLPAARIVRDEPATSPRWEVAWTPRPRHLPEPQPSQALPDDVVVLNAVAPDVGGTTLTVLDLERWEDRWNLRIHAASDRTRWWRQVRTLEVDVGDGWTAAWMTSGATTLGGLATTFRLPHPPRPGLRLRLPDARRDISLFELALEVPSLR